MTATPSPANMSVNPDIVDVLMRAALFRNFTETGLKILGTIAQDKQIPEGAPLFVEGMIGDGLYVIAAGQLRLSAKGPQGQDVELIQLGPGESVGEASLLRSGPRLCSAIAMIPSRVLEISRRDLVLLQRTKPQACLKLMMGVVDLVGERMQSSHGDFRQFLAWKAGL